MKRKHIELLTETVSSSLKSNSTLNLSHDNKPIQNNLINSNNNIYKNEKQFKPSLPSSLPQPPPPEHTDLTNTILFCKYELHKRSSILTNLTSQYTQHLQTNFPKHFSSLNRSIILHKPKLFRNTKAQFIINNLNFRHKFRPNKNRLTTYIEAFHAFQIPRYLHNINTSQYLSITSLINHYIITFDMLYTLYNTLRVNKNNSTDSYVYEIVFRSNLIHLMQIIIAKGKEQLHVHDVNDNEHKSTSNVCVVERNDNVNAKEMIDTINNIVDVLLQYKNVLVNVNYQMIMKHFEMILDNEIGNVNITYNVLIKDRLSNNDSYLNKSNLIYIVKDDKEQNTIIKTNEIIKRKINIHELQTMRHNIAMNMFNTIVNVNVYYVNTISLINIYLSDIN